MKKFEVTGMSCAACSARVERAVSALDGVRECSVNLLTGSMTVEGDVSAEMIISAVEGAGYGATEKDKTTENVNKELQKTEKNPIISRLISSAAVLTLLMYISMGHVMWGAPLPFGLADSPTATALIELMLSAVILVINQRFFISGARALVRRSPNMDTLVALGAGASFIYSTVLVLLMCMTTDPDLLHSHLHGLYFESAAMILVLITVGKMLEERAKGRTTDAIRSLMELSPKMAVVVRDGREVTVPVSEVRVGDEFIVRPGESVPVDGVVLEGESSISEAALTGESVPRDKSVGDTVLAATTNTSGFLRCRATKVGSDTAIASVIRMVEDASASKAPIAKVADRVSGIFVPAVLLIAVITLAIWLIVGAEIGYALGRAISVLVISCPCALGLATPVAIMVGTGVGAKHGILYKSAEAIELTGRAKIVALDKTGTVTEGEPGVTDLIPAEGVSPDELLQYAYSIEKMSEHPLARAVVRYAEESGVTPLPLENFSAMAGSGVRADVSGEELVGQSYKYFSRLGTPTEEIKAVYERLSDEGKTPLFFTRGGRFLGVIATADRIRPDSRRAVAELSELGLRVVMLTGDNSRTARAIGRAAGIDEIRSDMLPGDKVEAVRALRSEGGVIMVGDGINDAPSLTVADVGIAVGGGTDIAIESADVVLMRENLTEVSRAVRLGRSVLKNIYENLFWAFIYNTVGIPLAAGAFVFLLGWEMSPMIGALAMSLSSFSVVMNALRLGRFTAKEAKREQKLTVIENEQKLDTVSGKSQSYEEKCELKCCDIQQDTDGCDPGFQNTKINEKEDSNMTAVLKIEGMMCPHCEGRVKATLEGAEGVLCAEVSHVKGEAIVTLSEGADKSALAPLVEAQGYKVTSVD